MIEVNLLPGGKRRGGRRPGLTFKLPTFEAGNDIVAGLFCGTALHVQSDVRVWGTEGNLVVPVPWKPLQGQIVLNRVGAESETIEIPARADCYALEADVMARNIGNREAPYPCMTWRDSLGNMKALDQWRAAVGLVFDAEKYG